MQDTMIKVRALFKAQSALTRIELRAKTTQAVYVSLALVFGFVGLGMLNVGAFLGLSPVVGPPWSAVLLGVVDALLAVMIVRASAGVTPGPEAETAKELRDLAVESLSTDAERLQVGIQGVKNDIGRVRSALSVVSSGAAGLLPGVSSVVGLLTSTLKKKK